MVSKCGLEARPAKYSRPEGSETETKTETTGWRDRDRDTRPAELVMRPVSRPTTLVTSEGAVSHYVLYYMYQQLPITPYQVRFYANNYF